MDDGTASAAERIGEAAVQLQDLAVQGELPFLAHVLRLVILEAKKATSNPVPAGQPHIDTTTTG